MKKVFALMIAAAGAISVNAQQQGPQPAEAETISKVIRFKETDHDFGKIPYGKPAEFSLAMTNISSDSVTIEDVKVGCGCTTPKWKPGPYAPGQDFDITIGFNGYTDGPFNKVVTLYFKGGLSQVIKFHGETFKAPADAAPANDAVSQLKQGGN
ncbi:DUF1573 domain-containing protein [Parafilimonas sp.]|uniref:DUF1573 domain-containing protein n=1 Tax=Parafilimonas sp. TaxID=1969739 RepID=UPI0039E53FBC